MARQARRAGFKRRPEIVILDTRLLIPYYWQSPTVGNGGASRISSWRGTLPE